MKHKHRNDRQVVTPDLPKQTPNRLPVLCTHDKVPYMVFRPVNPQATSDSMANEGLDWLEASNKHGGGEVIGFVSPPATLGSTFTFEPGQSGTIEARSLIGCSIVSLDSLEIIGTVLNLDHLIFYKGPYV